MGKKSAPSKKFNSDLVTAYSKLSHGLRECLLCLKERYDPIETEYIHEINFFKEHIDNKMLLWQRGYFILIWVFSSELE